MQLGASIPVSDICTGPAVLRDYAQAAEEIGFAHLVAPMTTSCICLPLRHCALTDQNIAETLPDLYRARKLGDQRLATHTGCRKLAEPDNRDYRGLRPGR